MRKSIRCRGGFLIFLRKPNSLNSVRPAYKDHETWENVTRLTGYYISHEERILHLLLGGLRKPLSRAVFIAYFFDQDFHEHVSQLWMRSDRCTSGSIFFEIREFKGDVSGFFLFPFLALRSVSCGLVRVPLTYCRAVRQMHQSCPFHSRHNCSQASDIETLVFITEFEAFL
ncbi:hypothetical protein METSCH_A04190 [Metschnikowia aff. pulcherrima]|uniref:Uncharacterized protein n=1 Tax=Metschnikowia aff. pulcherrima TaxID=2163413 RepID=A0A4V1ADI1_9ASCO|nr:hypothetical protein METSCH_A04190 [Metschnikowia aff. pulcherrima]